jgi:hypothetical protein
MKGLIRIRLDLNKFKSFVSSINREMIKTLTMHNNNTTSRHIGVGLTHEK